MIEKIWEISVYNMFASLWLLELLVVVSGMVENGHVTKQTTQVTADDKVTSLEVMVKYLQTMIEELQNQRKSDQAHFTEMEKRLVLTHGEMVTLHSDVIQLLQTGAELQEKVTTLDENVGDLQLESKAFSFVQKQLQSDIGSWKQLKDHHRRSQRKLEKRVNAKIENLHTKTDKISHDLLKVQNNCSRSIFHIESSMEKHEKQIQNNTNDLQTFINNQSDFHAIIQKKTLGQRFEKLYKIFNISRQAPDAKSTFHNSEEIESEFIVSNSIENKLWNEVGSGDEGSGATIPVFSKHSHTNYVKRNDLLLELQERDLEITTLLDMYENLKTGLSVMEGRLQEIRLGNFMEKLQESFIKFTQNVLTMDQWKMASSQLVNSTQVNQQQIVGLTNMIFNNTNFLRELEMKLSHAQSLSYQQFSLLRIHIIQLNNTVQDMKDEWNKNGHHKKTQNLPPPVYVHTIANGNTNLETLQSRVEDIALQVVYNENRIAKLELKILNESLLECKKANADIFQDTRIAQIESSIFKMSQASQMVKEILNQVRQELYKEYLVNFNQSNVINAIIQDIAKLDNIFPRLADVQHQIDFFQFMLPEDCYGYYRRGYKDSGVYIINPIDTNLTLQVYCDLEDGETGWTVIQKRMNGRENFDKTWADYKAGFGDVFGEFWIGNDLIHILTTSNSMLKIDMIDIHDVSRTVTYDHFAIESEDKNYKISVSGFQGNCSDSFSYSNDMGFSTHDRDNDGTSSHCAMFYTAGWWYKHCHHSNLNGRFRLGMVWYDFNEDEWIQLKYSAMKIKPNI